MSLLNRFYLFITVIVIIKIVFALMLPMTGDEVYFVFWARNLDYGYYDHTPMVAWILSFLLSVSDAQLWLRLPAILFSILVTGIIYKVLYQNDDLNSQKTAIIAASIYSLIPVNLVAILITTDTALIWWSFLCGVSYYQAQKQDSFWWYLICGLLLGLAFLSKFFSGLLVFAFLIHTVFFVRRGIKPYIGLLIIFFALLPFLILNLSWNYNNCWNNYLFNLVNRNEEISFSLESAGKFLLSLVFIMPPGIYYLVKDKSAFKSLFNNEGRGNTFLALFIIPVTVFGFLSLFKSIGLHWFFSFIPFLVLGLVKLLSLSQLEKTLKFMVVYSFINITVIGFIIVSAPSIFQSNEKFYKSLIVGFYSDEMLNEISKYKSDFIFATDSYALSAQLSYYSKEHVIVFGEGSYHARHDDFVTDFRKLQGENILIISETPNLASYAVFFNDYKLHTMIIQGAKLYYAIGKNFRYEQYRETILTKIRKRYYNIPSYVPHTACYMDERYAK